MCLRPSRSKKAVDACWSPKARAAQRWDRLALPLTRSLQAEVGKLSVRAGAAPGGQSTRK